MNAEDVSIFNLPEARQIMTDCRDLASQLRVPLESVYWMRDVAHTSTPYRLYIKVSSSGSLMRTVEFTLEEITGYLTGQTTTTVKAKIQVALESVRPDLDEL
jgi:hypothetical protein